MQAIGCLHPLDGWKAGFDRSDGQKLAQLDFPIKKVMATRSTGGDDGGTGAFPYNP